MAALFRLIAEALGWGKKPAKVLVVGLDDSGKTTLLNFLKPAKVRHAARAPRRPRSGPRKTVRRKVRRG